MSNFIINPSSFVLGVVGGWKELGRTTLGSDNSTIDVTSLADKKYLMILANPLPSGTLASALRVGNDSFDSGNNYAIRWSANGASDQTRTDKNLMALDNVNQTNPQFHVGYIANKSDKEKLTIINSVGQNTAGAGTAPDRVEQIHKWANTSNEINQIQLLDDTTGTDIGTGSEVVVLGWSPDDTHTTNFWEQLASVELGSSGDTVDSGTFTAKKYLWFQFFSKATGGTVVANIRYNADSGSNYSFRDNDNGSESTSLNESRAGYMGAGSGSTNQFGYGFIINNSANEKLSIVNNINQKTAGAGNAPTRREHVAKWTNTSSQITSIQMVNTNVGSFDVSSILKVWGSD